MSSDNNLFSPFKASIEKEKVDDSDASVLAELEAENTTEYEPVVRLKPVKVDSGESNETEIYKQRCILYRYIAATNTDEAQWKERGRGEIRFLQHTLSRKVRVILREDKTLKLRLNHIIPPNVDLKSNSGSDRFWTWRTEDYTDPEIPCTETFGVKLKTSEIAKEFHSKWVLYQLQMENQKILWM